MDQEGEIATLKQYMEDQDEEITTLKMKLMNKDEAIYHLKSKYKTCEAEQADQQELGSDLVLSLQATIRSLEAKITALRQAEAAARQVVS